ncbi:MAG: alkylation response protein AidB-like acyl-CoA dehydrogenase [Candidatus Azotimanducaceae bacterium]|jgi:alkylation response protein AidB-like acyl-CoA dehydrogenase
MYDYKAPLKEMQFVIEELAELSALTELPGYEDANDDLVEAILEQAGKFAEEVIAPLNQSGDVHGTFIENGQVISPPGFMDAFKQFSDNGWLSIKQPTEFDGQGLPNLLHSAVTEIWNSSNIALALCPLLTSGAIESIDAHASDTLKQQYLRKMISGQWTGTMNLTESHAGTDLAAIRTRAERDGENYRISGQKIYITWGEHEMTENIIHLVLARLPDAPEGVKGISLFLVPKFLVNEDGSLGDRNDLKVVSLEHKLGIHASPTCVMSYGDNEGAVGYLIGEENNGLACMFTMMNNARHEVGMQGVGLSERAYQAALAYAQERVQGYAHGSNDRVTIIHHPDVRRILMQMRALSEASRAFGYVTASMTDLANRSVLDDDRSRYQRRLDLYIPIVKSWCSEMSQEVTYLGVQVHGGMGFVEETGVAQYMRDARILTIYEGTTGIQALDLMGRKMWRDQGQGMGELIAEMELFENAMPSHTDAFDRIKREFGRSLIGLKESTQWFLAQASDDPYLGGSIGVNYMMQAGNVIAGWLMARSAVLAQQHIDAGESDVFYSSKITTALFFAEHILPRSEALKITVQAGSGGVMGIDVDAFKIH